MSEALVRSLNLPAVQVLEAYGPKRFTAKLRNVGLPLYLPNGAAPNLSLILGGAGAKLEDMAAAYTAFARHGKAGKLRLQPDDPLLERPLMSSGLRGSFAGLWLMKRNPCRMVPCRASPHWHGKRAPAMAIVMPGRLGLTLAMSLGSGLADRTARPLLVSLALPAPYHC